MTSKKTLVLGIGNPIMQDDGVGVYVVRQLKEEYSHLESVEFLDGGTLGFALIGQIESASNLIVVDAARFNAQPGSVKAFHREEMDNLLNHQKNASVHDLGLIDLMSIAALSEQLPDNRVLIGIQPESVDLGTDPTETVKKAIPIACNAVKQVLTQWMV